MLFLLGLASLVASIALAAPLFDIKRADVLEHRDGLPPPSPLTLINGGVRVIPVQDAPAQLSLPLPNGATRTLEPSEPTASIFTTDEQATVARRALHKPAKKPGREQPPAPRPLSLVIGGYHTLPGQDRRLAKRTDATPTAPPLLLTTVHASSGATATPITEQRQLITTHVASYHCVKPTSTANATSCETVYIPTITPVCNTQLLPLAASPITITDCNQYATFKSEYGYELRTASTSSTVQAVQTRTTYWAAPWSHVLPGVTPTAGIEVICGGGACETRVFNSTSTPTVAGGDDEITATIKTTITSTVTEVPTPL